MQIFGSFSILLALLLAVYALVAGIAGLLFDHPKLRLSSQRAALAVFPAVTAAVACLEGLIFRNDFSVSYVAEHSNRALPFLYKFAVLWSGQEGSLLFWSWVLSGYTFIALLSSARRHRSLTPLVAVILAGIETFFLLLNNFAASAFSSLPVGIPADGNGLNPLLQYPQMVVHPPMLYMGYVGFSVPFAFALAALIKRYPGDRWIHVTRRWTMVAWGFLTVGIVLGGYWAYSVLGWGGYWAWDPVENASFLPWLTGTAFLHSVMMQEKRGMLKVWNVWLIFGTFLLSIFGDFLTRSGIVNSVHAFAQSSIGNWFLWFLGLVIAVCLYFFFKNRDLLASENRMEHTVSRESSFLFNNFVLLMAALVVLWGTLFPVLSEAVTGQKITVGRAFFNHINVPIFLFLLFLTGVGPLLAWRKTSLSSLRRNFLAPSLLGGLTLGALVALGIRDLYALIAFSLASFVVVCILMEFGRGARVLAQRHDCNWATATVQLVRRNTRRYGGYVIHLGIVLMAIGLAGSAFNKSVEAPMPYRAQIHVGPYTLISDTYTQNDNANYRSESLMVRVLENGHEVGMLYPSRRFYKASGQAQSMVVTRSTPLQDLYLVYAGNDPTSGQPVLHAYLRPLVMWLWLGAIVVALGTLLAILPARKAEEATPRGTPQSVTEAAHA